MSNITIINGNIFNTKAQTIVNTVNCVGVMGKGIALVFKLRYPAMFDIYQDFCKQGLIGIGKLWIYKGDARDPWVLNFPTKTHWKLPSEYEYIEKGAYSGMVTMNGSLAGLVEAGHITQEIALEISDNKTELEQIFRGVYRGTKIGDDE